MRLLGCHCRSGKIKHLQWDPQDLFCRLLQFSRRIWSFLLTCLKTRQHHKSPNQGVYLGASGRDSQRPTLLRILPVTLNLLPKVQENVEFIFLYPIWEFILKTQQSSCTLPALQKKWRDEKLNWECSTLEGNLGPVSPLHPFYVD